MEIKKMYDSKWGETISSPSGFRSHEHDTYAGNADGGRDDLSPLYAAMVLVGSDDWYFERDLCTANEKTGNLILPGMNQALKAHVPFTEDNLIEYMRFLKRAWGELRKEISNLISERDKEDARGNGLPDEHRRAWVHVINCRKECLSTSKKLVRDWLRWFNDIRRNG